MSDIHCSECAWRARYDSKPKSFLGRLWRWHINFCPGWKKYIRSLPEAERTAVASKYNFRA